MSYRTTGYHTCRDEGGATFIRQHAPFEAEKDPFLSKGYYFWEFRVSDAHLWGNSKSRYPRGYAICQCQLELHQLLDLEYPPDLDFLYALEKEMEDYGKINATFHVGELIQWLRDRDDVDLFPFDSVRMRQEPPRYEREQRQYAASQPTHFLTWKPQFIICTFSKNQSVVRSCTLIYPEQYLLRSR